MKIELDYVKVGDYYLPDLTAEPYTKRIASPPAERRVTICPSGRTALRAESWNCRNVKNWKCYFLENGPN